MCTLRISRIEQDERTKGTRMAFIQQGLAWGDNLKRKVVGGGSASQAFGSLSSPAPVIG